MNYFYLLRHGQKQHLKGDPGLSELGIKQAEFTAKYLKQFPIKALYSSPSLRAKQTADDLAKAFNLAVAIDKALEERMNWGDDPNLSFEEFIKLWDQTSLDREFKPKVGYSSYGAGKRLERAMDFISKKYDNSHIVLVTHGGIIGDFLQNVFEEKDLPFVTNEASKVKYIKILECSITIVGRENDQYFLKELAYINHIPFPIE